MKVLNKMEIDPTDLHSIYKALGYSFVPIFFVIMLALAYILGYLDDFSSKLKK